MALPGVNARDDIRAKKSRRGAGMEGEIAFCLFVWSTSAEAKSV
jgi:hypothetical protein